jgi:hypothetical protein
VRFSLFFHLWRGAWRVVRRERWPTREERERIRERIAEAGSVRAWLLAGRPNPDEVRARKAKLNALADKCGMARLYPEGDEPPAET